MVMPFSPCPIRTPSICSGNLLHLTHRKRRVHRTGRKQPESDRGRGRGSPSPGNGWNASGGGAGGGAIIAHTMTLPVGTQVNIVVGEGGTLAVVTMLVMAIARILVNT